MTDPATITAVVIVTALAIANAAYAHRSTRRLLDVIDALDARLLRVEDAAYKFAIVDVQEPKYSAVTLESADWCAKRKKFVTNVRVVDKAGTRRHSFLVDSIDDAALRTALEAKEAK